MYGAFVIIGLASLTQLSGSDCFKFSITRDLNSTTRLEKTDWTHVEVTTSDQSVAVKFDIPKHLLYSDAFIFFASDTKTILQVKLGKKAQGKLYAVPYHLVNEMEGGETTEVEEDDFSQVSSSFPRAWLPKNCSEVSAAVVAAGRYFNYYKMQNFKISLPDLMVVEEYMKIPDLNNYSQNLELRTAEITESIW